MVSAMDVPEAAGDGSHTCFLTRMSHVLLLRGVGAGGTVGERGMRGRRARSSGRDASGMHCCIQHALQCLPSCVMAKGGHQSAMAILLADVEPCEPYVSLSLLRVAELG